jgi:hypothetical protein
MFQFPRFASGPYLVFGVRILRNDPEGVSPFGDPRIEACVPLPGAYRSLPRPSSPPGAKASTAMPLVAYRALTMALNSLSTLVLHFPASSRFFFQRAQDPVALPPFQGQADGALRTEQRSALSSSDRTQGAPRQRRCEKKRQGPHQGLILTDLLSLLASGPRHLPGLLPEGSAPSGRAAACQNCSRKEVIQPQVLLQLPCYDFTPIADHTLDACLP